MMSAPSLKQLYLRHGAERQSVQPMKEAVRIANLVRRDMAMRFFEEKSWTSFFIATTRVHAQLAAQILGAEPDVEAFAKETATAGRYMIHVRCRFSDKDAK